MNRIRNKLKLDAGLDVGLLPDALEEAVRSRCEVLGCSQNEYEARLLVEGERGRLELAELVDRLGIGHTNLFRHRAVWDRVVRELTETGLKRAIEALILGCSTGEEAYTLVMELGSRLGLENISVLAVDLNRNSLETARRGWYGTRSTDHVPSWAQHRYLAPRDGGVQVRKEVRRRVRFTWGDLLSVPLTGRVDLVLMRHVLIYFFKDARQRALDRAAKVLRPGGLLVLGASELQEAARDERFVPVAGGLPVFRRAGEPARPARKPAPLGPPSSSAEAQPEALVDPTKRIHDLLAVPCDELEMDLNLVRIRDEDDAWTLARGLRLLAERGTLLKMVPPDSTTARALLEGTLLPGLVRDGLARWQTEADTGRGSG